jgi:hypothetical protein
MLLVRNLLCRLSKTPHPAHLLREHPGIHHAAALVYQLVQLPQNVKPRVSTFKSIHSTQQALNLGLSHHDGTSAIAGARNCQ